MHVINYFPEATLSRLTPGCNDLMQEFLGSESGCCRPFPVNMELTEGKDYFKIMVDLPGMEKDKIKIAVERDVLTISGEKSRDENGDHRLVWSERFFGTFSRAFTLPKNVDNAGISADYKNGILELTLPKKEEAKPKEIEIKLN